MLASASLHQNTYHSNSYLESALWKAPFDFCGGMMFQLVLTDKLREHLASVADGAGEQPMVFDSFKPRILRRVPAGQEQL